MSIFILKAKDSNISKPIIIWADNIENARINAEIAPHTLQARSSKKTILNENDWEVFKNPNISTCDQLKEDEYKIISNNLLSLSIRYRNKIYNLQKNKSEEL
ncbi:hypothetical protein ACNVED_13275 [Legionella sp. D16C41]|uniref:hypothetical protein n=1 Tax=Legionella sp. D16C41 TaxID=3402688 RepID=UPI003AF99801